MSSWRRILAVMLVLLCGAGVVLAAIQGQPVPPGALRIRVFDASGAAIQGARVVVMSSAGNSLSATDQKEGLYTLSGVPAGEYQLRVEVANFVPYESKVTLPQTGGERRVVLQIQGVEQKIFVTSSLPPSATPEFIGGVRVLRGAALDTLPNTEAELRAYLRLLAPLSAGPFGPAISVDGFSSGVLPPKSSIREIRINDNPFSSEYSDVGLSRIEILTKPGTESWQSGLFFNFNDESLNSRNSFSPVRVPFQRRIYGMNVTGPILRNKLTLAADANHLENDDNTIINATTVDSSFNIQSLNKTLIKPTQGTNANATFNYQISRRNTLVGGLQFSDQKSAKEGVGGFSLESRAYQSLNRTGTLRLTETAALSEKVLSETRFQFVRRRLRETGNDSLPTIEVPEAFSAGGSTVGRSTEHEDSYILNHHLSWILGKHSLKGGAEFRAAILTSQSTGNRAGTYIFTGRTAPELDAQNNPVVGPDNQLVLTSITNIETYRRTLLFRDMGLDPVRVRELGGGASLFLISPDSAHADVHQYDASGFVQDNWQLRRNFMLSLGARIETQNNIRKRLDVAPRLGLTWEPFKGNVIRGGSGFFYSRVDERLVQQVRLNDINQKKLVTTDPVVLDQFPKPLSAASLTDTLPPSVWAFATNLRAPYSIHSSLSFERALPLKSTMGITVTHTRGLYALRSRNVNAPLPGGARPLGITGDLFQFEGSGVSDQRQVLINTTHNVSARVVLWTTYTWRRARSDTDGPYTFPADTYNLRAEYGPSASNARHTLYTGGWLKLPGDIELTPLVMWRSGLPFNITTGRDSNGDSQFLERPAFATDMSRSSVVRTSLGAFDLDPLPGQTLVPRNFGVGSSFAIANLSMSRYITISEGNAARGHSFGGAKRQLSITVQIQNLFNHPNFAVPVGNLSSPLFGSPTSAAGDFGFGSNSAGTRRVEASLSLSF